jgi:A/G-specific adenine glycosylase
MPSRRRPRPTCSAPGRGWATTAGRSTFGARHRSSATSTPSEVPSEIAALEKLPGIGPYTARAVAAIAFGAAVGAVDTNVRRVLGRALVDGRSGVGATWIQHAADAAVDPARPGDWTHALMDIGATVCRPRRPFCDVCPLQRWCATAGEEGRAREVAQRATRSDVRRAAFPTTRRWLRGRIVDRLRSAEGAAWTRIDGPIGTHDPAAVAETLLALAADGVVEQDPARSSYVRLATA